VDDLTPSARPRLPARFHYRAPPPPVHVCVPPSRAQRVAATLQRVALATLWLTLRAVALVAFLLLAMGEVFLGPLISLLALATFFLAVVCGFLLDLIPQRWGLLTMSVVLMLCYLAYRVVMILMLRIARWE
jgi:hypothetical protein